MPLAFDCCVLSHCPASKSRPARSACLRIVKSKLWSSTNCRPSRVPVWPAPPPVKASSTRSVGVWANDVFSVEVCTNSNFSSLNAFLPSTRVLRRRSVSVTLSVP